MYPCHTVTPLSPASGIHCVGRWQDSGGAGGMPCLHSCFHLPTVNFSRYLLLFGLLLTVMSGIEASV